MLQGTKSSFNHVLDNFMSSDLKKYMEFNSPRKKEKEISQYPFIPHQKQFSYTTVNKAVNSYKKSHNLSIPKFLVNWVDKLFFKITERII